MITLAVAGDITEPRHAWAALHTVVTRLLGPLGEWGTMGRNTGDWSRYCTGLATLDSKDWAYRGDYDNSDQGTDPSTAHGANYHQGPEWVWPVGFLLRALLSTAARLGPGEREEARAITRQVCPCV